MKEIPFRWFITGLRTTYPDIEPKWDERYVHIRIEQEIVEYAKYVQDRISERTLKQFEAEKGEQGILGQEIFNEVLLELKIPNLYAYPLLGAKYKKAKIYRIIEGKHYDFYVPRLPKNKRFISVKTIPMGRQYTRFMANVDQWKNEWHHIALAVKIDSLKKARLFGWLYAKEVIKLPKCDFGKGLAYWTYLDPNEVERNRNAEVPGKASI